MGGLLPGSSTTTRICRRERPTVTISGCTVTYIPNGNDPPAVQPPGPALAGHGLEAGRYLLFLARLVPEKGCDVLIRALRESDTGYQLAIVGGASYSDEHAAYLRRLAGDDSRIRFLGFQSGAGQFDFGLEQFAVFMALRRQFALQLADTLTVKIEALLHRRMQLGQARLAAGFATTRMATEDLRVNRKACRLQEQVRRKRDRWIEGNRYYYERVKRLPHYIVEPTLSSRENASAKSAARPATCSMRVPISERAQARRIEKRSGSPEES